MDKVMTSLLICFNVFVLHGLVRCYLTSSSSSVRANYQKLIDQPTNVAEKLFYVSSHEQDSLSLQLKLAMDQVYFLDYNVSRLCSKQMRNISEGILRGEVWALDFLDSNGQTIKFNTINIVKILGSREQCEMINVKSFDNDVISGKYTGMSFLTEFKNKAPIELYITWYFCLPTSCTSDDYVGIETKFKDVFGVSHVDINKAKQDEPTKDHWYWAAVVALSTLAFTCILATAVDCLSTYCLTQPSGEKHSSLDDEEEEETICPETDDDDVIKEEMSECRGNLGLRMLQLFSLRTNMSDLLKTSSSEGEISCLHGLRVISMMWVIFGHVCNFLPELRDQRQLDRYSKSPFYIIAYSAPYAVDSFFLLSGCLVSYLFIKTVNKVGQLKPTHMAMYYMHRYLRLTPLHLLTILIYTGILPCLDSGFTARATRDECRHYWWRNILYINNLFKYKYMCLTWSWYLSNDMQFYVIAPLVTVPIVYGFHKLGLMMAFLMLTCHIGASTYVLEFLRISSKQFDYMTDLYVKPWNRVGPYAIGLVLGYFLSVRKADLRINKITKIIGWISCTALFLSLVLAEDYSAKQDRDLDPKLNTAMKRAYEIVKSPLWAICVTWVILACHFGYGGLLNTFLAWKAWIPLSKLTYGTYLCHMVIIIYFDRSNNYGIDFQPFFSVERFIFITILGYFMSLILSLLIEIPTRNLLYTCRKSQQNVQHYQMIKEDMAECRVKTR